MSRLIVSDETKTPLSARICMCCSGLDLSQSLVSGMKSHVGLLLRMVIYMCCSGFGLRIILGTGIVNGIEITLLILLFNKFFILLR